MSGPTLEEKADQVRALRLALEVRCPDPKHFHARPGVTCFPPSERWPRGWVCLARMEREIDSRAYREALRRREDAQQRQNGYERRQAKRNARRAAEAMTRVAAAARREQEGADTHAQEAPTHDHPGQPR